MEKDGMLDLNGIKARIAHRAPFLMLDRVLELVPGKSCHALKNVTGNEPFFQGHFPHIAIMPGVMILEAMAQAAGMLHAPADPSQPKADGAFSNVGNARFRRPVFPGDVLHVKVSFTRSKMRFFYFHGQAFVEEKMVAQADFGLAYLDMTKI